MWDGGVFRTFSVLARRGRQWPGGRRVSAHQELEAAQVHCPGASPSKQSFTQSSYTWCLVFVYTFLLRLLLSLTAKKYRISKFDGEKNRGLSSFLRRPTYAVHQPRHTSWLQLRISCSLSLGLSLATAVVLFFTSCLLRLFVLFCFCFVLFTYYFYFFIYSSRAT